MSGQPARLVIEGRKLIGTKFRLYGRDPVSGLDCVGLVALAIEQATGVHVVPAGYRLKNTSAAKFFSWGQAAGLARTRDDLCAGDVVHVQVGPAQHHLAILTDKHSIIHAHSGLARVVEQAWPGEWPLRSAWRLTQIIQD